MPKLEMSVLCTGMINKYQYPILPISNWEFGIGLFVICHSRAGRGCGRGAFQLL